MVGCGHGNKPHAGGYRQLVMTASNSSGKSKIPDERVAY